MPTLNKMKDPDTPGRTSAQMAMAAITPTKIKFGSALCAGGSPVKKPVVSAASAARTISRGPHRPTIRNGTTNEAKIRPPNPVESRAVFGGLILASLVVPFRMVGRWGPREIVLAALAALTTGFLTGLPPAHNAEPNLIFVGVIAAIAICALVLPGVSGSFILLSVGIYEATLAALNDRDLAYIGVFLLGATIGLAL